MTADAIMADRVPELEAFRPRFACRSLRTSGDTFRGRVVTQGNRIQQYYDCRVQAEWERLQSSWLEYAITRHFIGLVTQPGSEILDIGGGPGRYALDLAAKGHRVDLADLSPANVAFAEEKARAMGTHLRSARVADACDLSMFRDDSFDAVLNLGPLYHLVDEDRRVLAVLESLRVLRPGGFALFAFISRYAPVYFSLKTQPERIGQLRPLTERILERGAYHPGDDESFFVESHFIEPGKIGSFMERFDVEEQALFGAESLMAQSEAMLLNLPAAARQAWLELAIASARTPAALYASEHLVFVGRKPFRKG